jgi:hypothetical protein
MRGYGGKDYCNADCYSQSADHSHQEYPIHHATVLNDFLYNLRDFTAMQCILIP